MATIQLSSDPFSRVTVIRRRAEYLSFTCSWCGGTRGRDRNGKPLALWVYGTCTPMGKENWEGRSFCSKECHDSYRRR